MLRTQLGGVRVRFLCYVFDFARLVLKVACLRWLSVINCTVWYSLTFIKVY